jgi:prepilin-type N-terminal cleavage/methylation domain-containing protein
VSDRAGFSLPEALIALTISSVLVLLVGALFLVQNDFYAQTMLRTQVQENARAMTEMVAADIRSVALGSAIIADSSRLVLRTPLITGMVCGTMSGTDVAVHVPGGTSSFTTSEVAGFGYLASNGTWSFYDNTWAEMNQAAGTSKTACFNNGADTLGTGSSFLRLREIVNDTGIPAANLWGSTIVLYRNLEFRFNPSTLVPGERSLYRGTYQSTLAELATGLSDAAHFEYWTGAAWSKLVTGATLNSITRVRLVAQSEGTGETSQQSTFDFGWTVDIPLPNAL